MPERTIVILFNPLVGGVYPGRVVRFCVAQEVELRSLGGSWRGTGSRSE